jgi:hypothetical protein
MVENVMVESSQALPEALHPVLLFHIFGSSFAEHMYPNVCQQTAVVQQALHPPQHQTVGERGCLKVATPWLSPQPV